MTTQSYTLASYDFTGSTGIRAWGSQLSTAIQDTGITKTSDTGQINWTTTTTGTGYEIYRFNDTLQSSAPIFLKLTYSSNSAWLNISNLQTGVGTDGAGNLTGLLSTSGNFAGTNTTTGSNTGSWTFRFVYNATAGFFGMTLWDDPAQATTGQRGTFTVARSCDNTGAPVGSGLVLQVFGGSSSAANQIVSFDANNTFAANSGLVSGLQVNPSLTVGTTVQLLRQTACFPTQRTVPQVMYYANADISRGTTFSLSPYGTSYTYIANGNLANSPTTGAYAMLWQ